MLTYRLNPSSTAEGYINCNATFLISLIQSKLTFIIIGSAIVYIRNREWPKHLNESKQ